MAGGEGEAGEALVSCQQEFLKAAGWPTRLGVLADHRQVAAVLQLLLALRRLVDEHADLERIRRSPPPRMCVSYHFPSSPLGRVQTARSTRSPDAASYSTSNDVRALQVGRAQAAGVRLGAADLALGPERERRRGPARSRRTAWRPPPAVEFVKAASTEAHLTRAPKTSRSSAHSRFAERPGQRGEEDVQARRRARDEGRERRPLGAAGDRARPAQVQRPGVAQHAGERLPGPPRGRAPGGAP